MKTFLAALILFGTTEIASGAGPVRLDPRVRPLSYDLIFDLDLTARRFSGRVKIVVELAEPRRDLVLHSLGLVLNAAATAGHPTIRIDQADQTATLGWPKPLPAGRSTLDLEFSGKLTDKLAGLYYAEENGKRYAFTQFEATDARRAFPCFDEPEFKARFNVAAKVARGDAAVSNGKVISETIEPGTDRKIVRFSETPPISTYLVALAVGPLVRVDAKGSRIPISLYMPPGDTRLARVPLEQAVDLLARLERYFGVPYPYDKLDLVAVPDFDAGGMENAAAIFFRDTRLLVEPLGSLQQLRHVAELVAHEMAHQWFGNLVTMRWWDDLWLNEAFASWMAYRVLAEAHPDWDIWTEFERDKDYPLALDALVSTHPIHVEVNTPEEANECFDGITYDKGAAVIRMLESYLGEETFRRGIHRYLSEHALSNTTAVDLWRALGKEANTDVESIAKSWIDQPGFPIIDVDLTCLADRATMKLSQRRYYARSQAKAAPQLWRVPLTWRHSAGVGRLLLTAPQTVDLGRCAEVPWVLVNVQRGGFYRVRYSHEALAALNRQELPPTEQLGLLSDGWAQVRDGTLDAAQFMDLVAAIGPRKNRLIIADVANRIDDIEQALLEDAAPVEARAFAAWVSDRLGRFWRDIGWKNEGISDDDRLIRASVLAALARFGAADSDLRNEAAAHLERYFRPSGKEDSSLFEPLLELVARDGDRRVYDRFLNRARSASIPERRMKLLYSLAEFRQPELVQSTLQLILKKEVRVQDRPRLLSYMLGHPWSREASWRFIRERFDELNEKMGQFAFGRVISATSNFCDARRASEVREFFRSHPVPGAKRELEQAVEQIEICSQMRQRNVAPFRKWLTSVY